MLLGPARLDGFPIHSIPAHDHVMVVAPAIAFTFRRFRDVHVFELRQILPGAHRADAAQEIANIPVRLFFIRRLIIHRVSGRERDIPLAEIRIDLAHQLFAGIFLVEFALSLPVPLLLHFTHGVRLPGRVPYGITFAVYHRPGLCGFGALAEHAICPALFQLPAWRCIEQCQAILCAVSHIQPPACSIVWAAVGAGERPRPSRQSPHPSRENHPPSKSEYPIQARYRPQNGAYIIRNNRYDLLIQVRSAPMRRKESRASMIWLCISGEVGTISALARRPL